MLLKGSFLPSSLQHQLWISLYHGLFSFCFYVLYVVFVLAYLFCIVQAEIKNNEINLNFPKRSQKLKEIKTCCKKSFFGPFLRPVLPNIETCQLIWFFFWLCWEHCLKLAKFLYAGNSALTWPEIYYCFQYITTIDFCWQSWYLWLSSC